VRYEVTGGPDGTAGIEIKGKRYEPGDSVELAGKSWLVDQGYLAAPKKAAAKATPVKPKPASTPEGGE
jgi:hypothetical protein